MNFEIDDDFQGMHVRVDSCLDSCLDHPVPCVFSSFRVPI